MNINLIMMEKFLATPVGFILQPYISPFPTNTDLSSWITILYSCLFSKFLMRLVWPRSYFLFIYTSIFIELLSHSIPICGWCLFSKRNFLCFQLSSKTF